MAAPAETSHPPCMSKPAWCLFQNLIHFNPPLIFFINIHSPVVFVIQQLSQCICCLSNKPHSSIFIWGKLPHVVFQHLLVIWVFTGQWWRPKVWLRCLFTASLCYFLQTCFYPFIPSPFQNCLNSHFHFFSHVAFLPCFSHWRSLWEGIMFMSAFSLHFSQSYQYVSNT